MGDPTNPLTGSGIPRRAWIGYLIAAVSLVWVFHDVSFAEVWREMRSMKPEWLALAIGLDVLAYLTQGYRWHRLLGAVGEVGLGETAKAIYSGLFFNEILPLRMGELLRIHLIARKLGGAYSAVVSSVVVERFLDAAWLAGAFGIVVLATPLPRFLVDAEEFLAALAFGGLAGFVALAIASTRRAEQGRPPSRHWLIRKLRPLGQSLVLIGRSRGMLPAALASSGVLLFQAAAFYFGAKAYGIPLPLWPILGAFLIQHVGNAAPGGPGNLGTYQLVTVLGLTVFGVEKSTATGFSVVYFLGLTIPLWMIGSLCFARSGLQLASIHSELNQWRARYNTQP